MSVLSFAFGTSLVLLLPNIGFGAINFTNGKWQTTFNCNEWGNYSNPNCDGLEANGSWTCSDSQGTKSVQITSSSNFSGGAGGRGLRQWYATPKNNTSGGVSIRFPSPQKELWVRWYQRAGAGLARGLPQGETKTLYFKYGNDHRNALAFGLIGTDRWRYWVVSNNTAQITPQSVTGYGWESTVKYGNWEAIEVYLKVDTNNADGVLRAWVNGTMILNATDVDSSPSSDGWTSIEFPSNHDIFGNTLCAPIDYDDVVIHNAAPLNRDANGFPFIGPMGWGATTHPPLAPSPPRELRTTDPVQ